MAVAGICQSCNRSVLGLFTCHACGSKVCPDCVDPETPFCNICHGKKRLR